MMQMRCRWCMYLIIGFRQLPPPDWDIHGVPPLEVVLPLVSVKAAHTGSSGVHHHLPLCLPLLDL